MSLKKTIPQRIVIHPRDVQNITGRSGRTAQQILQNIRIAFGKEKFQFVTISEFCAFTGIEEEVVTEFLKD